MSCRNPLSCFRPASPTLVYERSKIREFAQPFQVFQPRIVHASTQEVQLFEVLQFPQVRQAGVANAIVRDVDRALKMG